MYWWNEQRTVDRTYHGSNNKSTIPLLNLFDKNKLLKIWLVRKIFTVNIDFYYFWCMSLSQWISRYNCPFRLRFVIVRAANWLKKSSRLSGNSSQKSWNGFSCPRYFLFSIFESGSVFISLTINWSQNLNRNHIVGIVNCGRTNQSSAIVMCNILTSL